MVFRVSSLRNIVGGLAFAVGVGIAPGALFADACLAEIQCGGYEVSCSCMGIGFCQTYGSTAECSCSGFNTIRCNCGEGCIEIE